MSSQKPGKTKQKSLLSWVKPQDTKARVEDENVEESCAAEIPEGSSESGQDYAAVESVKAVGSQLKRVKTYLRSTTGEGRLNHLMLLHVHKELADGIDMVEVANLFVGDNQRRKQLFGKFSKNDLPMKSTFASKATQTV